MPPAASLLREPFGRTRRDEPVSAWTLTNANGLEARVSDYGGVILSLRVPDRSGSFGDVVLGYDSLDGYLDDRAYLGALIGRCANRIAGGSFTLDGRSYALARNNGPHHLHGGAIGFDRVVWRAAPLPDDAGPGLALEYASPDGEEGYPGTLRVRVTYRLTDHDELAIEYRATTDRATPVNLTQHSYFNLTADGDRDVLDHVVTLNAGRFTPVDATMIPTGELRDVAGTPFDFRRPVRIGERIQLNDEQLRIGNGYDHDFVLDGEPANEPRLAARVYEPRSGRVLEVLTTEPGVHFYTGNFLNGIAGKGGATYRPRHGFALETQHFTDSPNRPEFPSTILRPGVEYRTRTSFRFSVQEA